MQQRLWLDGRFRKVWSISVQGFGIYRVNIQGDWFGCNTDHLPWGTQSL